MESLGGTSLYAQELALELKKRGNTVAVYSPRTGLAADPLRKRGIPVANRIWELESFVPDVIHAHHHLEAMTALLYFREAPAVYVFHGPTPVQEQPFRFPRIVRYIAVSERTRSTLMRRLEVPRESVDLITNWADLARFPPRGALPARPRKALMLGNNFTYENGLETLRQACHRAGIELHCYGHGVGNPVQEVDQLLPQFDLVFGLGRVALEAMAVGCAVILCHPDGVGPFLSPDKLGLLRAENFGAAALESPLAVDDVLRHINRYCASEAAAASAQAREMISIEMSVDRLERIYEAALANAPRASEEAELEAIRDYVVRLGAEFLTYRDNSGIELVLAKQAAEFQTALARGREREARLGARIEELEASLTWQLGQLLAKVPFAPTVAKMLQRFKRG